MNSVVLEGQKQANKYLGTRISEDGVYGSESQSASVRVLQHAFNLDYRCGLAEDGIYGSATDSIASAHYVKQGEQQEYARAVQVILLLRGYNPNGVDGIFGGGTWSAVACYQGDNGLAVDGIVGYNTIRSMVKATSSSSSSTNNAWSNIDPNNLPNFTRDEFKCQCGCGRDITDEMKRRVQCFRTKLGKPMTVTDGFRCPTRNAQEGGTTTSLHLEGKAVDFQILENGSYKIQDSNQKKYREIAHECGLTTGNYYGPNGGWMHLQIGRNDYDEYL